MDRYLVDLQLACEFPRVPTQAQFESWVSCVLQDRLPQAELTIRIVDVAEMTELNETYRPGKQGPTNILSFPFEAEVPDMPLLGDLIICADVMAQEAKAQGKPELDHWAHLTIHGTLHLLGYDHVVDSEAEAMEALETELLAKLDIANPYQDQEDR